MFRRYPFVIVFVFLLIFASTADAQKRIGERFVLGVGESVFIVDAGFFVGFEQIVHESRCPRNVECIWMGNATARTWAGPSPEDQRFFELNTHPDFQRSADFRGLVIKLLDVAPYPIDGVIIDPDDYVVSMVVLRPGETVPADAKTWGAIKELYK